MVMRIVLKSRNLQVYIEELTVLQIYGVLFETTFVMLSVMWWKKKTCFAWISALLFFFYSNVLDDNIEEERFFKTGAFNIQIFLFSWPWHNIHVLVCPRRDVQRFVDLTCDETSDLWLTAQKIGRQLESYHKASSLTFAIQVRRRMA